MAGTIVVDRIESDASYASTINVAGQITFSNTVNFGAYSGTAPVAGMYLPATNTLSFTTASTERMRIDNNGNVGIGTTTPGNGLTVSRSSGESVIGVINSGTGSAWLTLTPGSSGAAYIHNPTTRNTIFTTNTIERMSIDSSGVVALNAASGTPRFEVMSITDSNNQGLRLNGSGDSVYHHLSATSNTLNFQQYVSSAWRTAAQIVGNSTADFKFNSGYGSAATAYGCRAWVNFNGTGTVAIRASGNVSSITDNSAGNYTVNFTTAMPDANYCVTGSAKYLASATGQNLRVGTQAYGTAVTTTAVIVNVTSAGNATETDAEMVNVAIFR